MKSVSFDFKFVLKAVRFEDLMLPGEDRDHAFKRLAKIFHPDKHIGPDNERAKEVFQHINGLFLATGRPAVEIGKWKIRDPFASGDIADLYLTEDSNIFKIARNRKDNDLMEREAFALKKLVEKPNDALGHYSPRLVDSLTASGRRVNVIEYREGYIPLSEIADRLGGKVPFRHCVWMMNRLLSVLGWAKYCGIAHGAVVPDHLLYKLSSHDLLLVDWCYSSQISAPIKQQISAIVPKYKHLYPSSVLNKREVSAIGLDVYMAATTILSISDIVPHRFTPIFDWAVAGSPNSRPDLWEIQDRWRTTAQEEYGKPKFVNLELPVH